MPDYNGEPIRIATKNALNFGGRRLVPSDVSEVTVEIFTGDLVTTVLPVTPMDYVDDVDDDANGEWAYIWDTTGQPFGSYRAKVVITPVTGKPSWEYHKIRLKKDLHPAP